MEHSPAFRKALFLTLYFAQGALLNYFLNYNSTYLHDTFGINEREIGLFGLVLMPGHLKHPSTLLRYHDPWLNV
ncbi:MAG: hypothetical protein GX774_20365, partial [Armatimonadetes bacterium]|nr:hypothetical protein [Armatimonadota bacterium]